jgi:hypothetical protein
MQFRHCEEERRSNLDPLSFWEGLEEQPGLLRRKRLAMT